MKKTLLLALLLFGCSVYHTDIVSFVKDTKVGQVWTVPYGVPIDKVEETDIHTKWMLCNAYVTGQDHGYIYTVRKLDSTVIAIWYGRVY